MGDNHYLFKYFREELIDKAARSHVVLPVSILDKEGGFAGFVTKLGPKHLLQLLATLQFGDTINNEILSFTRSCLSLLNITFTILNDIASRTENFDSVSINWANDSLNKCIDDFSVSVCIYLFVTCSDIHDLILSLLLRFVKFSDKARSQMFKIPVGITFNKDINLIKSSRMKKSKQKGSNKHSSIPQLASSHHENSKDKEKSETCLSYLITIVTINRSRELISNFFIEIVITLLFNRPENMNTTMVCDSIASSTTSIENNFVTVEWTGLKLLTKLLAQSALSKDESKSDSQFYGTVALVMACIILNSETVVSYLKTIPDVMNSIFNYLSPEMNIEYSHAASRFIFQEFYDKMKIFGNSSDSSACQKIQICRQSTSNNFDFPNAVEKVKLRSENNEIESKKISAEFSPYSLISLKTPSLPRRINAEEVLRNTTEYLPNIDNSVKYTEKKTMRLINKLSNIGEIRDGKNTVPIVTRATRIYLPQGYPMYSPGGPMSLLALQIETRKLLKSRASTSRDNLSKDSERISLQVSQDQISTNIKGLTSINSIMKKVESPKVSEYYNPTYDSPMGIDEIVSMKQFRLKKDIETGHTNNASPKLSKEIMIT